MSERLTPEQLAAIRERHEYDDLTWQAVQEKVDPNECDGDEWYETHKDRAALLAHVEALDGEIETVRGYWATCEHLLDAKDDLILTAEAKLARLIEGLSAARKSLPSDEPSLNKPWSECIAILDDLIKAAREGE